MQFTSQRDKCVYTAKIVLRCRQMPGTFLVQGETLNNDSASVGSDLCDLIPDDQIEWRTDQRATVIFDGLCVRLKPVFNRESHQHTQPSYNDLIN